MRVGIVGAGLAGLAAARTLASAGGIPVVFERERTVGGRVGTVAEGGYVFDPGTTTFCPRGKELERVILDELDRSELVTISKPIYLHEGLRPRPGDPVRGASPRYTYSSGNARLPELLAARLTIQLGHEIEEIKKLSEGGFLLDNDFFEAVILTAPAPQALEVLGASGESRPIGNIFYRPCISVLLGYPFELAESRYHALLDPDQRHPLTWLSLESVKSPGRAPKGHCSMVAQMSPAFSQAHMDSEDSRIVDMTCDYIARLYGDACQTPAVHRVVRYRSSQPEAVGSFDAVNRPGAKLILASDGLMGARTEHAYEAGVKAAKMLLRAA